MKKSITLLLSLCMLLSLPLSLSSCASPALEDIYDRVVELVEGSYEINSVFYGVGLPVWRADSEYAEINHVYYDFAQYESYEYVSPYSKFITEEEIMNAARRVYGRNMVDNVLSVSAFTGYAIEDSIGGSVVSRARYILQNNHFCKSTKESDVRYTEIRIYDYSTMQVHSLGRSDACSVTMDSYLESDPSNIDNIELYLILQDGEWYLDSFTGA